MDPRESDSVMMLGVVMWLILGGMVAGVIWWFFSR